MTNYPIRPLDMGALAPPRGPDATGLRSIARDGMHPRGGDWHPKKDKESIRSVPMAVRTSGL